MTPKKVKIFVAGTFDIIHVGHIRFLWAAKKLAKESELIVVVARDSTVKRIKGRKPIFSEEERLEIISNLKPVDKAMLGYSNRNLFDILLDIKPDIVALGYDQKVSEKELYNWAKQQGLTLRVIRLPKFYSQIDSSSKIRKLVCKEEDR